MAGPTPGGTMPSGPHDWHAVPGIGYRLSLPQSGIRFDVTRIRREHQETIGLLTVRVTFRGAQTVADNIVSSADFNCSGQRSRSERAKFLRERTRAEDIDWVGLLEELCLQVLSAEDQGDPERPLEQVPIDDELESEMDAGGLPVLRRHPTIWFGDGGCGKSYLALSAAVDLAQRGERVLYCDWEFAGDDHRRRLHRLAGPVPHLEQLFYRRCDRPFVRDVGRLKEIVAHRRITFLICDSLGFAAEGAPESAEAATGYFRALRELGQMGSLHLAHISKAEQGDQKPFGSVFWANGARSTWYLKRTDAEEGGDGLTVGFYHRKSNVGRLRRPFGERMEFLGTATQIRPTEIVAHDELAAKLPVAQRMHYLLKHGAMPTDELAEMLKTTASTIRTEVKRKSGTFLRLADGRIGLADQS
jgi:hypothetical protein